MEMAKCLVYSGKVKSFLGILKDLDESTFDDLKQSALSLAAKKTKGVV